MNEKKAGDEYLWDGSGPVEADVARLEAMLRPYRYDPESRLRVRVRRRFWPAFALAAAVAFVSAAALVWVMRPDPASWEIMGVQGSPQIAGVPVGKAPRLAVGEWLQTDASSSAEVQVADIGSVTVDPDSRIRIVGTGKSQHRMELAIGRIQAFIMAPPKLFLVDTPSAVAVDYGCMYSLQVQRDGSTLLNVTLGLVKLESGATEAAVPRGVSCISRPGMGPGTPFADDANDALRTALTRIDAAPAQPAPDDAVGRVLAESGPRDAVTLWHLIRRVSGEQRIGVVARLASLSPLPSGVSEADVVKLDPVALEAWWDAIYLSW